MKEPSQSLEVLFHLWEHHVSEIDRVDCGHTGMAHQPGAALISSGSKKRIANMSCAGVLPAIAA